MAKYSVWLTKTVTYERRVTVEAEDEDAAREAVEDLPLRWTERDVTDADVVITDVGLET